MSRTASGTVSFRGNPARWWARITVRDENGAIRRPWVDLERPDLANTPTDKKTAQRLALKRAKVATKMKFKGVERATAPKVTLAELEDKWFTLLDRAEMKPATRAAHKSNWRANIKPKLGEHPMTSVWTPILRAWIRDLRSEASPSTVRNQAVTLSRFFGDVRAERWVHLESNPMKDEDVRSELPSVSSPEPDAIEQWSRDAFERLLAVPSLPDVWFGLYLIGVTGGERDGELHGCQFKHVQFGADVPHVRIRQQLGTRREGEPPTLGAPKTRYGKRDIPMHPAAQEWLEWWKAEGWALHTGKRPTEDDFVFPNSDGEPSRPCSPKVLRGHLEAAGLPTDYVTPDGERSPFDFHAIRHTFATWLGANGVDGDVVDRLLGQTPRTTRGRHYQSPSLPRLAAAVATIELTLPNRPGVAYLASAKPLESSHQLSQQGRAQAENDRKHQQDQAVRHPSSGVEQRFRKP